MTTFNIKAPLFRYEVHTFTLCQDWINCWTVYQLDEGSHDDDGNHSNPDGDTYFDSYPSIDQALDEIFDLEDPENHRVYDNATKQYVLSILDLNQ